MINVKGIVTNTDAISIDPLEVFVYLTLRAIITLDVEKFEDADKIDLNIKTDEIVVSKGTEVTWYAPDDFEIEVYDHIANLLIGQLSFLKAEKNI